MGRRLAFERQGPSAHFLFRNQDWVRLKAGQAGCRRPVGTQEMRFAVIRDTREWSEPEGVANGQDRFIDPGEVENEARRRKGLLKLDEWQLRQYVTDRPVPDHIVQMCQQIDLAAQALSRLSPIPSDYANDLYWPRMW